MADNKSWRIVSILRTPVETDTKHTCLPINFHYPTKTSAEKAVERIKEASLTADKNGTTREFHIFPVVRTRHEDGFCWDYRDCKIYSNGKGNRFKVFSHTGHLISIRHYLDRAFCDIDTMRFNQEYRV